MVHSFQLWFVLLLNNILSISYQSVGNNIAILIDSVAAMQNTPSHFRKMYSLVKTQGISKSDFYDFLDKLGTRFFLCLARIFLPLSHIGTTPRGCGTKKLKYSCLLCGRRKESPGFFFAGMQRRGPGMKKWRFLSLKSSRIKISHSPFFD